jgi:hypothetical protein
MLLTLAVLALYNFILLSVLATVYGGMKAKPDVLLQLYQNKGWTKYGFLVMYFALHGFASITALIGDGAKTADKLLTQGILFAASMVATTLNKPKPATTASKSTASSLVRLLSLVTSGGNQAQQGMTVAPPSLPDTAATTRTRKRIAGPVSPCPFLTPTTSPNQCSTPLRPAAVPQEPDSSDSDGKRSPPGSPQTPTGVTNSLPLAS